MKAPWYPTARAALRPKEVGRASMPKPGGAAWRSRTAAGGKGKAPSTVRRMCPGKPSQKPGAIQLWAA